MKDTTMKSIEEDEDLGFSPFFNFASFCTWEGVLDSIFRIKSLGGVDFGS